MTATLTERLKGILNAHPLFWAGYATLATVDQVLNAIQATIDHKPVTALVSVVLGLFSGFMVRWFLRRAARLQASRDIVIQYALGMLEPDVAEQVGAVIDKIKAERQGSAVAS